jgi:hypothetical protein
MALWAARLVKRGPISAQAYRVTWFSRVGTGDWMTPMRDNTDACSSPYATRMQATRTHFLLPRTIGPGPLLSLLLILFH